MTAIVLTIELVLLVAGIGTLACFVLAPVLGVSWWLERWFSL
jgi:hypothetical protein